MLKRLANALRLTLLVIALLYALTIGSSYRGVIMPETRWLSLAALAGIGLIWLVTYRGRYRTPLDLAIPLWFIALVLALLANPDQARRILVGMWYVGVFLGLWYLLMDLLNRQLLSARRLTDGLLLSGVFVMLSGYIEAFSYLRSQIIPLAYMRLSGILINPNLMAFFLAVILMLALSRLVTASSWGQRIVLSIYLTLALVLLVATYSRTAWISLMVAVGVWLGLLLHQRGLLSFRRFGHWWQQRNRRFKVWLLSGAAVLMLLALVLGLIIAGSVLDPERGLAERPRLFASAWRLFTEQPLTGHGLNSFGRYYGRFPAPNLSTTLSNAHNLVFNTLAELGLVGLAALLLTAWLAFRGAVTNWQRGRRAGENRMRHRPGPAQRSGGVAPD
jgi:O-antigen ligase